MRRLLTRCCRRSTGSWAPSPSPRSTSCSASSYWSACGSPGTPASCLAGCRSPGLRARHSKSFLLQHPPRQCWVPWLSSGLFCWFHDSFFSLVFLTKPQMCSCGPSCLSTGCERQVSCSGFSSAGGKARPRMEVPWFPARIQSTAWSVSLGFQFSYPAKPFSSHRSI